MYPPPPWHLFGWACQTLHSVSLDTARALVPPELRVVPVWPGATLGCLYLASYGRGSVLQYHELIVCPAVVWAGGRLGLWVSHIYVDHAGSLAGGREIWGLPKEMAEFDVQQGSGGGRIAVRQPEQALCTVYHGPARWGVRLPVPMPVFGVRDRRLLFFAGQASGRVGPVTTRVDIPRASPFAGIGLRRPFLGLAIGDLTLVAPAPDTVAVAA